MFISISKMLSLLRRECFDFKSAQFGLKSVPFELKSVQFGLKMKTSVYHLFCFPLAPLIVPFFTTFSLGKPPGIKASAISIKVHVSKLNMGASVEVFGYSFSILS